MRTTRSLLSSLVAAALCVAADRAAAQPALAYARSAVVSTPAADAPRAIADYRFATARSAGLPYVVTVADSAGTLVASYRLPGDAVARQMFVEVLEDDLVLQAETPSGVLTLVLYGQNDPQARRAVGGRWALGDQRGTLRGRVVR